MAKYKPLPVFWPSLSILRYVNSCRVLNGPNWSTSETLGKLLDMFFSATHIMASVCVCVCVFKI